MNTADEVIVGLLTEIRELLVPISDSYRDEYEQRQAERNAARLTTIRETVNASPRRRSAWDLADGTRTQREIARQSGLDEGSTSKFFKALRELGALTESSSPTRTVEVKA